MRRQDIEGMKMITTMARSVLALFLLAGGVCLSQGMVDAMRGRTPLQEEAQPPALQNQENRDVRRTRAFAMQPPTIPHKIDGYQIDRNANRCMTCHARTRTEESKAI